MKIRAVQALNAAMDLGLHARGSNGGHFAEADRRTWWMTVGRVEKCTKKPCLPALVRSSMSKCNS